MPPRFGRFERAISASVGMFFGTILAIIISIIFLGYSNDGILACIAFNIIFLYGVIMGIYTDPTEDILYLQQQRNLITI